MQLRFIAETASAQSVGRRTSAFRWAQSNLRRSPYAAIFVRPTKPPQGRRLAARSPCAHQPAQHRQPSTCRSAGQALVCVLVTHRLYMGLRSRLAIGGSSANVL